jgi:hypothetical protein
MVCNFALLFAGSATPGGLFEADLARLQYIAPTDDPLGYVTQVANRMSCTGSISVKYYQQGYEQMMNERRPYNASAWESARSSPANSLSSLFADRPFLEGGVAQPPTTSGCVHSKSMLFTNPGIAWLTTEEQVTVGGVESHISKASLEGVEKAKKTVAMLPLSSIAPHTDIDLQFTTRKAEVNRLCSVKPKLQERFHKLMFDPYHAASLLMEHSPTLVEKLASVVETLAAAKVPTLSVTHPSSTSSSESKSKSKYILLL